MQFHQLLSTIIAALAGSSESVFNISSIFGFLAIVLAAINIFERFKSNSKNASNVQKRKIKK